MCKVLLFLLLINFVFCHANDGSYLGSGNQLIPIMETDISVQKEILEIKRINKKSVQVNVYYEFFNPNDAKEITVGFEAVSPYGDADVLPVNGRHPSMRNFTVNMDGKDIKYKIAYVYDDSSYVKNGKIKSEKLENIRSILQESEYLKFYYVYHFNALFEKGTTVVKHSYVYDLSNSVDFAYDFSYVLTAANRWANKQIDDFTLIIDMGEFETFNIGKTFFKNNADWEIDGIGKKHEGEERYFFIDEKVKGALRFHLRSGEIVFHKKNFSPQGELYIYIGNEYVYETIPYSYHLQDYINPPTDELEEKVLRNLPYARRGYIFKDKKVQKYYENEVEWYIPDPDYVPNTDALSYPEKEWIMKWKHNNQRINDNE